VLLEITGPAGARWQAGAGQPVATIRTDPVSYLRILSGGPAGQVEVSGDAATASVFLAIRV
jgi:hypothetical protein